MQALGPSREQYYPLLLPHLCFNRYDIAEGVCSYSNQTWQLIMGGQGRDRVARYIAQVRFASFPSPPTLHRLDSPVSLSHVIARVMVPSSPPSPTLHSPYVPLTGPPTRLANWRSPNRAGNMRSPKSGLSPSVQQPGSLPFPHPFAPQICPQD